MTSEQYHKPRSKVLVYDGEGMKLVGSALVKALGESHDYLVISYHYRTKNTRLPSVCIHEIIC